MISTLVLLLEHFVHYKYVIKLYLLVDEPQSSSCFD